MSGNDLCPASAWSGLATIIKTLNKGMPGTCSAHQKHHTNYTRENQPPTQHSQNFPSKPKIFPIKNPRFPNCFHVKSDNFEIPPASTNLNLLLAWRKPGSSLISVSTSTRGEFEREVGRRLLIFPFF